MTERRQHKCHANKYPDENPIMRFHSNEHSSYWGLLIREGVYLDIKYCPHCGEQLEIMTMERALEHLNKNVAWSTEGLEAWEYIKEVLANK